MNYKISILMLYFASYSLVGFCQEQEWLNYTLNNNPGSLAISDSEIWTCSEGGIIRVNKNTEEIINYNHANSILSFTPRNVFVDSNEQIWFYNSYNIGLYYNNQWDSVKISNLNQFEYIRKVIVSKTNRVYLSIKKPNSVYELINDSLCHVFTLEPTENKIQDIEINSSGDLWIAGIGLVIYLNEEDTLIYNSSNSPIPDKYIRDIYVDNNDNLWIIPEQNSEHIALLNFNGTEWTYWEKSVFSDFSISLNSIVGDEDGILYVSSFYGTFKFENESWEKIDDIDSDNLTIDSDNKLWCISRSQVRCKTENGWKIYELITNELDTQSNYCITNNLNSIFVGGRSRIASFDGQNWEKFSEIEEVKLLAISIQGVSMAFIDGNIKVSSNMVSWQKLTHIDFPILSRDYNKIYVDSNNEFWIGTSNGLFHFQNNELIKKLNYGINDIDQDSAGNLWLASDIGLIKYNDGIINTFDSGNSGLVSNYISNLSIGNNGEIWLAVQKLIIDYPYYKVESNFTKFQNDVFENYDILCCGDWYTALDYGFPIDKIIAGINDEVWINYKFQGLMHYKDEVFSLYNHQNSGLADNNINDFLIDTDTNIFIIHNRSLSIFNKNGITLSDKEPITELKHFLYPNPSNGKFSIVFDRVITDHIHVNICDHSGKSIYSNSLKINSNKLDLHIEGLKSGLFFFQINAKNSYYSGKILILRR